METYKSFLTDSEFTECKSRLQNILDLHQNRYKAVGKLDKSNPEIARRIEQSKEFGSLCLSENDLAGEIWKPYKADKIDDVEVSSYGRVRHNKKIVSQKDSEEKGKEVGYLILDTEEKLPKCCVYQMVAEAFLKTPALEGYVVHHITNNGYDNSVGNLIFLTKEQHVQLNH